VAEGFLLERDLSPIVLASSYTNMKAALDSGRVAWETVEGFDMNKCPNFASKRYELGPKITPEDSHRAHEEGFRGPFLMDGAEETAPPAGSLEEEMLANYSVENLSESPAPMDALSGHMFANNLQKAPYLAAVRKLAGKILEIEASNGATITPEVKEASEREALRMAASPDPEILKEKGLSAKEISLFDVFRDSFRLVKSNLGEHETKTASSSAAAAPAAAASASGVLSEGKV
jgi:hypothetical protein